jgi:hypothetical protein
MILGVIGMVAGGVAILLVFLELWLPAATFGGVFVIATFAATVLLRRADPDELRRRQTASERYLDALARSFASASGAWGTRERRKHAAGTGEPPRRQP